MKYELTFIVPVYNEERRLPVAMTKLFNFRHELLVNYEVLFVNNASLDGTEKLLNYYARRYSWVRALHLPQKGKGLAIQAGVKAAQSPLIYMADVDFSTPLGDLPKFLNSIHDYQIVIGSRALEPENVHTTLKRRLVGRAFHWLAGRLVPGVSDTQCGFKMFQRAAADDLFSRLTLSGWAFDVELLYLAQQSGYTLREIPVRWINDPDSRVNLLTDSLAMLRDLAKIPIIHRPQRNKLPA